MIIKVTQDHIDKGKTGCTQFCPVALALKEATGLNASSYNYLLLWKDKNTDDYVYDGKTPKLVKEWIDQFDKRQQVEPFTFEIDYENQS